MKKVLLVSSVIIIILIVIVNVIITSEIDSVKSRVGQKVILEKDTVMIIDYSLFFDNYTLSNGKEISVDLADKLKK